MFINQTKTPVTRTNFANTGRIDKTAPAFGALFCLKMNKKISKDVMTERIKELSCLINASAYAKRLKERFSGISAYPLHNTVEIKRSLKCLPENVHVVSDNNKTGFIGIVSEKDVVAFRNLLEEPESGLAVLKKFFTEVKFGNPEKRGIIKIDGNRPLHKQIFAFERSNDLYIYGSKKPAENRYYFRGNTGTRTSTNLTLIG